ncbi:hypothetical protein Ahy_A03g015115 [Arachis hypogaea]|uniref:Aminotransferase-like plant mobile domain-containing protein n=1 Tax=Arachis hypogaea TaxID=3818 RepID=A0A445DZQ5_ARAHY|nr:hypothetical protein Ahy_A03g015115 [Arachis hypogaea]
MKGYIIKLIEGILFPDASDSRVHIRWLPLLEDLDRCVSYHGARLCWHGCTARCVVPRSMVNAIWVVASVCCSLAPIIIFRCYDPMDLILVDFRWWVEYRPDNATGEHRLRHYRHTLNWIGILNISLTPYADPQLHGPVPPGIAEAEASAAVVCPLLCFAIVEWHQVDRFGGLQHIPTRPLAIDEMHRHNDRFG